MKRKIFANKLFGYMEDRILEICEKYRTGNYNEASYYAFVMGAVGDIQSFLEKKHLSIKNEKPKSKRKI